MRPNVVCMAVGPKWVEAVYEDNAGKGIRSAVSCLTGTQLN